MDGSKIRSQQKGKYLTRTIVYFFLLLVGVQIPIFTVAVLLDMAGWLNLVQKQLLIASAQTAAAYIAARICLPQIGLTSSTSSAAWKGGIALPIGICIGGALAGITEFMGYRLSAFTVYGYNPAWDGLYTVMQFSFVAVSEEIIFRGFVLRSLQVYIGTDRAILYSSLLFTAFHFLNGGFHPTIAYMMDATVHILPLGLILASLYVISKRLWLPVGFHFGWNAATSAVTGFAPIHLPSLLQTTFRGSLFENVELCVTLPVCLVAYVIARTRESSADARF